MENNSGYTPSRAADLNFTKRWARKTADDPTVLFPSYVSEESEVRAIYQQLFDEIALYLAGTYQNSIINNIGGLDAALTTKIDAISATVLSGVIPAGSLYARHFSESAKEAIRAYSFSVTLHSSDWNTETRTANVAIPSGVVIRKNARVDMYAGANIADEAMLALRKAAVWLSSVSSDGDAVNGMTMYARGMLPQVDIPVTFVIRNDADSMNTQYELTQEEPQGWSTEYVNYFTKNGDVYTPVPKGEAAPTWQENTYYALNPISPLLPEYVQFSNAVQDYVDADVLRAGGIAAYFEQQIGNALQEEYE